MKHRKLIFKYGPWIASILLMALIFYFSSIPGDDVSQVNDAIIRESATILPEGTPSSFLKDMTWLKSGHVIGYGMLGVTLYLGFIQIWKFPVLWSTFMALLYAISDEVHQSFVPGRSGSVLDVVLDTSGALVCAKVFSLVLVVIHGISERLKSEQ